MTRRFRARVAAGPRGALVIAVPFDPDAAWGDKPRHHVNGTVAGRTIRAALTREDGWRLKLGAAWARDNPVAAGDEVEVVLAPEGPQRPGLDADIAAALDADPKAAAFFDGLAQFYRKGFLTWIAGTKARPEERARRIAQMVRLLAEGSKQRE